ncbi:MAG: hypothetical protein N3G78_09565 [Desulfobacterota bacterium]|nr:hypothetical protein [Thermodesulfobacteriota bacterium]
MKLLQRLRSARRLHLLLAPIVLYAGSWIFTEPSLEEKVIDRLEKFCHAEYWARKALGEREARIVEFYRNRYRMSLESISRPLFDYRDRGQVQAFLIPKGFLYEAWEEGRGRRSYLLAKVVSQGRHRNEGIEPIEFDYLILGKKRIEPHEEYRKGILAGRLISFGGDKIYIHRDLLDHHLRWYFESLYQTDPKKPESHYIIDKGYKDPYTFFLYQDLKELCEDLFVKRLFRKKTDAREYFIDQGFHLFLPTLLAMATKMAREKDLSLSHDERYVRAVLSGLSEHPRYTLFYLVVEAALLSERSLLRKVGRELKGRFEFKLPETITLEQIARVSGELLRRMEKEGS